MVSVIQKINRGTFFETLYILVSAYQKYYHGLTNFCKGKRVQLFYLAVKAQYHDNVIDHLIYVALFDIQVIWKTFFSF